MNSSLVELAALMVNPALFCRRLLNAQLGFTVQTLSQTMHLLCLLSAIRRNPVLRTVCSPYRAVMVLQVNSVRKASLNQVIELKLSSFTFIAYVQIMLTIVICPLATAAPLLFKSLCVPREITAQLPLQSLVPAT